MDSSGFTYDFAPDLQATRSAGVG